jgi:hypothetical protein
MNLGLARRFMGAALIDWPRFEWWMCASWVRIKNRRERIEVSADGQGVRCLWPWTSDLHVASVFPRHGRRLLHRTLREWPIGFECQPPSYSGDPEVTFVLGHRGEARLPHLKATISSIAAQRGTRIECFVVEQSAAATLEPHLPSWVRYLHTPVADDALPYNRSWALNCGARVARGEVLVLHDNDILVPRDYALQALQRHRAGFEAIDLKRFLFNLSAACSSRLQSELDTRVADTVDSVMQNARGGSLVVSRHAFLELGGLDESFSGWGGEDNEFWERAMTRATWAYGYLPMIHLWHPSQPLKASQANPTLSHYGALAVVPPADRIRELRLRDFGSPTRPAAAVGAGY